MNRALMIQELSKQNQVNDIPIFPVHNLWSIYNNVILITDIKDYIYIKNLHTKHKTILYLYDINHHDEPYGYAFKKEVLQSVDILICRTEEHATKIKELFRDCNPLTINQVDMEKLINELGN